MAANDQIPQQIGTTYAQSNAAWLGTLTECLVRNDVSGPLFFYGTRPNSRLPREKACLLVWMRGLFS